MERKAWSPWSWSHHSATASWTAERKPPRVLLERTTALNQEHRFSDKRPEVPQRKDSCRTQAIDYEAWLCLLLKCE